MEENKLSFGREIGLYYCVGAARDLADVCGGLEKIGDYLQDGDGIEIIEKIKKVIIILNKWWCKASACNGDKVDPVTPDELDLYMDPNQMPDYVGVISKTIERGTRKNVKTKPIPAKGKNAPSGPSK